MLAMCQKVNCGVFQSWKSLRYGWSIMVVEQGLLIWLSGNRDMEWEVNFGDEMWFSTSDSRAENSAVYPVLVMCCVNVYLACLGLL